MFYALAKVYLSQKRNRGLCITWHSYTLPKEDLKNIQISDTPLEVS